MEVKQKEKIPVVCSIVEHLRCFAWWEGGSFFHQTSSDVIHIQSLSHRDPFGTGLSDLYSSLKTLKWLNMNNPDQSGCNLLTKEPATESPTLKGLNCLGLIYVISNKG